jgi:hypothetical protein
MPSIGTIVMLCLATLFASLTIASPIEHLSSANTTTFAPTIEARTSVTNGWMNWYQTCRACSIDPIRVVGWTNNVCRKSTHQEKRPDLDL